MASLSITTVLPVSDMEAAVSEWSTVLGVDPTFVDGDRWAQFDVGGTRLALAGADRESGDAGVLVKVDDVAAHVDTLRASDLDVEGPTSGAHEQRAVIRHADGTLTTLYSN